MALPTVSDNKFPKLVLEEVANDGSATTTPAADHRALFLGEDGGLHLKDSSATVTDIGGGSVSDILDLPTAETDSSLVLAPDGAGGVEFRAETGGGGGSSRPYIDTLTLHATYGDDFTGALNTSLWTRRTVTSGEETANVAGSDGWMNVDFSSAAASRLYLQTAPAGDFEIILSSTQYSSAVGHMTGPVIIDSTGAGVAAFFYNSSPLFYLGVMSAYAYASFPQTLTMASDLYAQEVKVWMGLKKSGTNYSVRYSFNGHVWSPYSATSSQAFTVDRIGFGRILGTPTTHRLSVDRFNVI